MAMLILVENFVC